MADGCWPLPVSHPLLVPRNSLMNTTKNISRSIDRTFFYSLLFLLLLYITLTLRTFHSLPTLPTDLFARSLSASDFHRSYDHAVQAHAASEEIETVRRKFPISISGEESMEIIAHPGVRMSKNPNVQHQQQLRVPKFWDPSGYGPDGIRSYLGYGDRLMTREEALSVGSLVPLAEGQPDDGPMLETIFVAISSYRDDECPNTVESIFSRAKYPQRVRVGVVDQTEEGDMRCSTPPEPCSVNPDHALCKYKDQIDFYVMEAKLGVGPVFARHLGHRMYRGEYFAAQCDAHVSFVKDWDEDIIRQWRSARNEMAILTAYLSDVIGSIDPDTGLSTRDSRPIMCKSGYEGGGLDKHLRHGQQPEGVPGIHGEPTIEPYWAAGFSFGRGHFVANIPYDQHLPMIFQGEEISMGLRAFSYGYDFFTPERSVCFHMYAIGVNKDKRHKVKLFWENGQLYPGAGTAAMMRLNGIIGMDKPGTKPEQWDHTDEKKYGIGKVRTLRKFFDTFGIHTEKQTVEDHLCRFVGKRMQKLFVPNLREDGMGIDYDKIHYKFKDPDNGGELPPM